MTRLLDLLKGLFGLVLILLLLAGVPALLLVIVGYPLPTELPPTDVIRAHIADGDIPDAFVIKALALVIWFVWAQLAAATLVEAVALARGRVSSRAPVLPGVQLFAGKLVTSTLLIVSAFAPSRSLAAAPIVAPEAVEAPFDDAWGAPPAADGAVASTAIDLVPGRGDDGPVLAKVAAPGFYTTQSGDNWWDVAERLLGDGMRWSELRSLNSGRTMLTGEVIDDQTEAVRAGWQLSVPADADPGQLDQPPSPDNIESGDITDTGPDGDDNSNGNSDEHADGRWSLVDALRPESLVYEGATGAEASGAGPAYQVVEGDNLWDIAERHLGDPFRWPEIYEASTDLTQTFGRRITDPNLIWPDSILVLPGDAVDVPEADPDLVHDVLGTDQGGRAEGRVPSPPAGPTPEELHDLAAEAAAKEAADAAVSDGTGGLEGGVEPPVEAGPVHRPWSGPADPGPDGPRGGDEMPDDQGIPAGVVAVAAGSALLAAGLLGLLTRARRLRLAEIGEASVPAPPPLELVDIETVLRNRADRVAVDTLAAAVASLTSGSERPDEPVAVPEVLRVTAERIEAIVVDTGEAVPTPWREVVVTGASLPANRRAVVVDPVDLADAARSSAPTSARVRPGLTPTLVTVGEGLSVNLEAIGVVEIGGRAESVAALVRAIVHELSTASIAGVAAEFADPAEPAEVILSDRLPEIGLHPGVRSVAPQRLIDELEPWFEQVELRLAASSAAGPWGLRLVEGPAAPSVVVVLDGSEVTEGSAAAELVQRAQDRRLPLAVVTVGPTAWPGPIGSTGSASWTVRPGSAPAAMSIVVEADAVRLQPIGLAAVALDLDLDLILGAEALIDHARRAPIVPRPDLTWAAADLEFVDERSGGPGELADADADPSQLPTEETPEHEIVTERPAEEDGEQVTDRSDEEESGLLIRVLGPVELEGGPDDLSEVEVAILAFLALAGPSTADQIAEAIAPGRPEERQVIDSTLVGLGPRLGPLFPQAGDGRHRVRSTITDLGSARRWVAQAGSLTEDRARNLLQLALSEVRGRPFAGAAERYWQWVEDHRFAIATQATSLLIDACFDLCDSAYAADDFHLALWACEVGSIVDPLNETAVIRQVQLLSMLDRPDEAADVVARWEAAFTASAGRPAPHGPRLALDAPEPAVSLPADELDNEPAPTAADAEVTTHVG